MAEDLNIVSGSKQEKYISITAQIEALKAKGIVGCGN